MNGIKMNNKCPKSKLKIHFVPVNNRNTGSARIRVYNILQQLDEYFEDVTLGSNFMNADIVVFQKIINLKKLEDAKMANKFVCYDIDDYFPQHFGMIKNADLVITSTEYLREKLLELNPNIIVSENCLDIDDYDIKIKNSENNPPKFAWYGWSTNSKILDEIDIRNEVTVISDKGDMLYNADTIDEDLKQFDYIVIPQEKTTHNLCKTHCRFLKSLYLGIPALISDMPEYMKLAQLIDYPEQYIIKDLNEFKNTILKIKNNELELPKLDFEKIRSIILQNYSKEVIAENFAKQVISKYKKPNRNIDNDNINILEQILHKLKWLLDV